MSSFLRIESITPSMVNSIVGTWKLRPILALLRSALITLNMFLICPLKITCLGLNKSRADRKTRTDEWCQSERGKLKAHATPLLLLKLLSNGPDSLPVDVAIRLPKPACTTVLHAGPRTWLEPELYVIDELRIPRTREGSSWHSLPKRFDQQDRKFREHHSSVTGILDEPERETRSVMCMY